MAPKRKIILIREKVSICDKILSDKMTVKEAETSTGIQAKHIYEWIDLYKAGYYVEENMHKTYVNQKGKSVKNNNMLEARIKNTENDVAKIKIVISDIRQVLIHLKGRGLIK